eukprot:15359047-Ditylum_brightwellii.AAC.1
MAKNKISLGEGDKCNMVMHKANQTVQKTYINVDEKDCSVDEDKYAVEENKSRIYGLTQEQCTSLEDCKGENSYEEYDEHPKEDFADDDSE